MLDDTTIRIAVVVSGIAAALFFWRVLSYRQPIVDLRTFLTNRNFALGSFYTFVVGTGCTARPISCRCFLRKCAASARCKSARRSSSPGSRKWRCRRSAPMSPRHLRSADHAGDRPGCLAFSMYLTATLTNQSGFVELFVAAGGARFALMFCYPAGQSDRAQHGPARQAQECRRSLQPDARTRGRAPRWRRFGTIMNNRLHVHWNRLIEDINPARSAVQQFLEAQTNRFDSSDTRCDPARAAPSCSANLGAARSPCPDLQRFADADRLRVRRSHDADAAGAPPALA